MTQLTFFPLGCADTTLIELQDGQRMLVDYANKRSQDPDDKRCDLPSLLRSDLKSARLNSYRVVAFTHLDDDHCLGASTFFHFDWASAYQGEGRIRIETLWVPASAITEEGIGGDARVIRQEARHRLRVGKGIKVFSRPERLRKWFEAEDLQMSERAHCLVDAGRLVPGFNMNVDGVEFFAHSPHAKRTDDRGVEDRNGDSLVFQARFLEDGFTTDVLFAADVDHEVLAEIVDITKFHNNEDRLHWNVYHLPHHCSYKSIGPNKGEDMTLPNAQVKWLCEERGERNGYILSSSKPIPLKGTSDDKDEQPPHRQAANYYKQQVLADPRNFIVTMQEPTSFSPKPCVIRITRDGAVKMPAGGGGTAAAVGAVAPRAG